MMSIIGKTEDNNRQIDDPEIVESRSIEVAQSVDITVSNTVEKPFEHMVQQRSPDGLGDAEYDAVAQSLPSITTRSEAQPAFENALNDDEIDAAGDDKIIIQETVDPTINDSIEQRLVAAGPSSSNADSRLIEIDHRPAPFARSNIQQLVEKPSKKRPRKGSPDDYPQILLHNAQTESAPSVGKCSVNVRVGYTLIEASKQSFEQDIVKDTSGPAAQTNVTYRCRYDSALLWSAYIGEQAHGDKHSG